MSDSSYRKTVEKFAETASTNRLPCKWCGESTLVTMLSQYGARCLRCFEAYCQEPMGGGPGSDTPQQAAMRKRLKPGREVSVWAHNEAIERLARIAKAKAAA